MTTHTTRIATLLATSLLLSAAAHAGYASSGSWNTTTKDEGLFEHFAGAVEDYNGTGNSNLGLCIDGVNELRGHIENIGYTNYRIYTDNSVYSTEWESSYDRYYADAGDLAYFSGHGGSGLFVMNGAAGDDLVWWGETRWGDKDVEVVAMDACQVLDATGRANMGDANAYDGVHWLLGFESNANDVSTTASHYGYYLRMGYSIGSAWRYATRDGHSWTQTGAYVRFTSSSCNTAYDTATSMSCDPTSGVTIASSRWSL
jgi:hypothetical protein